MQLTIENSWVVYVITLSMSSYNYYSIIVFRVHTGFFQNNSRTISRTKSWFFRARASAQAHGKSRVFLCNTLKPKHHFIKTETINSPVLIKKILIQNKKIHFQNHSVWQTQESLKVSFSPWYAVFIHFKIMNSKPSYFQNDLKAFSC